MDPAPIHHPRFLASNSYGSLHLFPTPWPGPNKPTCIASMSSLSFAHPPKFAEIQPPPSYQPERLHMPSKLARTRNVRLVFTISS